MKPCSRIYLIEYTVASSKLNKLPALAKLLPSFYRNPVLCLFMMTIVTWIVFMLKFPIVYFLHLPSVKAKVFYCPTDMLEPKRTQNLPVHRGDFLTSCWHHRQLHWFLFVSRLSALPIEEDVCLLALFIQCKFREITFQQGSFKWKLVSHDSVNAYLFKSHLGISVKFIAAWESKVGIYWKDMSEILLKLNVYVL